MKKMHNLIIVDESHNLRNPQGSRYRNIQELISKLLKGENYDN